MDRDVTVRFYQLEPQVQGAVGFADILRGVHRRPKRDRQSEVGAGLILRLEHLEDEDGLLTGDFTRVQTDNLPGHVTDADIDPLPIDAISHHVAFCFDPTTNIIALQFDVKMAVGRICAYAAAFGHGARFGHLPVLQQGALERFEDETPTKLRVKVARVSRFSDPEIRDETGDFEQIFEHVGALFEAPTVEIVVSARGVDGGINKDSTLNTVRRLLGLREHMPSIKAIEACTDESEDTFNFIKHLLKRTSTLELPRNDPPTGRAVRMRFARTCYDEHRDYLRAHYGVRAAA